MMITLATRQHVPECSRWLIDARFGAKVESHGRWIPANHDVGPGPDPGWPGAAGRGGLRRRAAGSATAALDAEHDHLFGHCRHRLLPVRRPAHRADRRTFADRGAARRAALVRHIPGGALE